MSPPDPSELLTWVTEGDEVLGPVERRRVHGNPGLVHRAAHILILHPGTGGLLLQKRSLEKDTQPGRWDTSVGGHVGYGQTYLEAALREAAEELGLRLEPDDLMFLYHSRIRNAVESENIATWLCVHAGPFLPDPAEVSEIRFWTRGEIAAGLGTGVFTPNFEEEFAAFLACAHGTRLR